MNAEVIPPTVTEAIQRVLDRGSTAALVTIVESRDLPVGSKLLVDVGGETAGDLGHELLNRRAAEQASQFLSTRDEAKLVRVAEFAPDLENLADSALLFERIEAEPRLIIAGAGHVGASLARLAAPVGYRVALIDDRAEFLVRTLFEVGADRDIELIVAIDWAASVTKAIANGRGVSVAIVTRGHKQDEDCLRAATAASPDYIGMIGSKRRTNIVLDKLREEGFANEQLEKVRAPIGLDIGAVSPEEVALSILAEIVAERRGGKGASLSNWRRD
jgi:xanthine dehydrogenase accessory factor